jgi:heat-inducible transcriptional repressor
MLGHHPVPVRVHHSAAVVVGPPHEAATVRSVQLVGLTPTTVLLVLVLSNGVVEKEVIELADEVDDAALADASAALSALLVGSTLAAASRVVAPESQAENAVIGAALLLLAHGDTHDAEQVFIGGASQIASSFDAVTTVTEILRILEEQYVVVSLLQDVLDRGLNVAIGTETGIAPLADCAVVVAPYVVDGEAAGTIGVLGPTRMNYPQALAAVAVVGQRLGRQLSEG